MNCWKYYIDCILSDRNIDDVAIVGLSDNKCVWATKPGGLLSAVSPYEVDLITGQDRKTFLMTGITIAGKKCSVIRDSLLVEGDNVMDVRSKGGDSRSICIGRTPKALIFLMGNRGVHGGVLNQKIHDMIVGMTL
ncbi:profilin-3 [Centrocercus urophasianus]|uniref:profilin-3 n=1 Tax=Centrocercus urophasianus TaxID=9002 RepID=UPI001C64B6C4|nr:profilin-3 [Centrocercus urophasianus]XP_052556514.1 profilin-3 [Tympanuchus pallidicinctus]